MASHAGGWGCPAKRIPAAQQHARNQTVAIVAAELEYVALGQIDVARERFAQQASAAAKRPHPATCKRARGRPYPRCLLSAPRCQAGD
jgi:hypothetical protein